MVPNIVPCVAASCCLGREPAQKESVQTEVSPPKRFSLPFIKRQKRLMRIQIESNRFTELIPIDGVKQLVAQPIHRIYQVDGELQPQPSQDL